MKGSHGTTKSREESIRKFGWRMGRGRAGTGVYFWNECEHYVQLAIGWYKRALKEKRYRDDSNKLCTVIIADLEAEEDEILDFDNRELRSSVYRMAKDREFSYTNTRELASVFDLFISELEVETGSKYKIITMEVAPPGLEYCDYPVKLLGTPICCAIRDTGCIDIIDTLNC